MSGSASTKNDRIIVGEPLRDIAAATPLDGRKVRVTWDSGETQIVDITPALASKRLFIRLRTDNELFRTLRVNEDGNAILWDDGAELTAVWIDRLASLSFGNADFREAMDLLEISLEGMAATLGISRRLIADYRKDKPIPNHIGLAVRYLLQGWAARGLAALGGTKPNLEIPERRRPPVTR